MGTIRWVIHDRKSDQVITVQQPTSGLERAGLTQGLQWLGAMPKPKRQRRERQQEAA